MGAFGLFFFLLFPWFWVDHFNTGWVDHFDLAGFDYGSLQSTAQLGLGQVERVSGPFAAMLMAP